jgi:hypothetical protein
MESLVAEAGAGSPKDLRDVAISGRAIFFRPEDQAKGAVEWELNTAATEGRSQDERGTGARTNPFFGGSKLARHFRNYPNGTPNIELALEHLSPVLQRSLAVAVQTVRPGIVIDEAALYSAFLREIQMRCHTWETVPDSCVRELR